MSKGIFITGTDTNVGKTIVAAGLAGALREKKINVGVMKPVESGALKKGSKLIGSDAELLKKASAVKEPLSLINPYSFEAPLAPSLAAELAGEKISPEKIIKNFQELSEKHQFLIVEGAGGFLVPLSEHYFISDLVKDLGLPLVIISRLGLGTINHTLLTLKQARLQGINVLGIIFTDTKGKKLGISEKTNPEIISRLGETPILGTFPYLGKIASEREDLEKITQAAIDNINLEPFLEGIPPNAAEKSKSPTWEKIDKNYLWHPFTQMQDWEKEEILIIEEGRGSFLKDTRGRWYLDGISSLWVNLHGHRREELDTAIRKQLEKIAHSTLLGLGNIPSAQLAKRLVEISPPGLSKTFYSDNGSTAVEIALKIAFQYWQQKGAKKKTKFVSLENAYHGDTLGAVSIGGIDLFHQIYYPFLFNSFKVSSPYCYRCSLGKSYPGCQLACLEELEKIFKKEHEHIAAFIIEPLVQGAAGMLMSPPGYLLGVRKLCSRYKVLLIADEVATGFGRTGKMFACEHENVAPDILILAKGLTGGYLPLAATLTTEEIYQAFLGKYEDKKTFFHGHTYTGNPLGAAVSLANLDIFKKEKVIEGLPKKIKFFKERLEDFKDLEHVGDIRQKGMMVGIELVSNKKTKQEYPYKNKMGIKVAQKAREKGLIIRPLGNVIVLMPPLSISSDELRQITDITRLAINQTT